MEASNGSRNGGARGAVIAAIAAIAVAFVGNTTVYFSARADRQEIKDARNERRTQENQFFRSQCSRDNLRDRVVIQALKDAKRRANSSLHGKPLERVQAISAIQRSIDQLETFSDTCKNSIPD